MHIAGVHACRGVDFLLPRILSMEHHFRVKAHRCASTGLCTQSLHTCFDLPLLSTLPACPPCRQIVKQIDLWGIDMVFVVGGNGGNAGAAAIQEELEKNNIICR